MFRLADMKDSLAAGMRPVDIAYANWRAKLALIRLWKPDNYSDFDDMLYMQEMGNICPLCVDNEITTKSAAGKCQICVIMIVSGLACDQWGSAYANVIDADNYYDLLAATYEMVDFLGKCVEYENTRAG